MSRLFFGIRAPILHMLDSSFSRRTFIAQGKENGHPAAARDRACEASVAVEIRAAETKMAARRAFERAAISDQAVANSKASIAALTIWSASMPVAW